MGAHHPGKEIWHPVKYELLKTYNYDNRIPWTSFLFEEKNHRILMLKVSISPPPLYCLKARKAAGPREQTEDKEILKLQLTSVFLFYFSFQTSFLYFWILENCSVLFIYIFFWILKLKICLSLSRLLFISFRIMDNCSV